MGHTRAFVAGSRKKQFLCFATEDNAKDGLREFHSDFHDQG